MENTFSKNRISSTSSTTFSSSRNPSPPRALESNFFRSLFYFATFFCLEYKFSDLILILISCLYGGTVFAIIPITYEELMSRLSPYYLVTINVLITMSAQIVSVLIIYGFGLLFNSPGKFYGQIFEAVVILVFMINVIINTKAIMLASDDDKRPSIMYRFGKARIVDGNGESN